MDVDDWQQNKDIAKALVEGDVVTHREGSHVFDALLECQRDKPITVKIIELLETSDRSKEEQNMIEFLRSLRTRNEATRLLSPSKVILQLHDEHLRSQDVIHELF